MHIEVLVPNLPESVSDATLINWHKAIGEQVKKGENLVDLETDKVVLEVPAQESGILTSILKPNGSIVISGDILALISATSTTATPIDIDASAPASDDVGPLSPAVRRLLIEHSLDPKDIVGNGKDGRITKEDILQHLEKHAPTALSAPPPLRRKPPHCLLHLLNLLSLAV